MHSSSCFFICIQRTCPCKFSYPFWHTKKDTCPNMPVSLLHISNITHPYSVEVIEISSVFTSFPYIIWKQWQPADLVKLSDFSPFWLCVPAFQQVCLEIISIFSKNNIPCGFLHVNNISEKKSARILLHILFLVLNISLRKSKSVKPKSLTSFSYETHIPRKAPEIQHFYEFTLCRQHTTST